ncbi:MAG: anti-sigma factor antagonist [Pegethrix bostrychoides GSE-TBD4-15B]|jgi:anti-sigma B factor antagonist|uniref:Anti-sigma factor antagonist n=1 Tax=Pegethrix bostrychoides GSE-TBD4-15B TaxID=2839662 RepID=A0A951PDY5_9CYAN|nr:anti-sigma factor antagonist [Pegethrix bostrychoides GSE-TBD4-15B]
MQLKKQSIVTTSAESDTAVTVMLIELLGDVDGSTAPLVQADVLAAAAPNVKMILDMTQVAYLSSAGLRMLLSVYRQVSVQSGQVVLVGLMEEIQDTMSITGFLEFFTVADELEAAFSLLQLKAPALSKH